MHEQIEKIRNALVDLHDPSGVHLHRAWSACLAGLLAAVTIYFAPHVGQPIMVVAAMIFTHTNNGRNPHRQQLTMLRAAFVTILGICLLGQIGSYPLLKGLFLVTLSFLAQYVARFGSEYSFTLIWILILVAVAENPPASEITGIILNVTIGFFLAFICFFWFLPYNPQKALEAMVNRTKSRFGNLLELTVQTLNWQTGQTAMEAY
ncbi:MAG: hypothetical protein JO235_09275 [Chroococcidiopsidaceae cyanobacterium CP_BM_RX_35]|nr:hypothetical protein [Chroococcidiopsidaceae cyanobacterium CP_BM_RX_35]